MPRSREFSSPSRLNPIGELVDRFLARRGLGAKLEAASAVTEWQERVGPRIAAVTQALRVSEGTLFVSVSSSAWMMELDLMKGELLRHVNAGKGGGRIRQIVFLMGG
ncbi:MAG: DUF721 domain-containing protein [Gemmatimonadota bacterium]|nr:DUF721 domain-containing protein [Gemmatimonadota bacterium]